MGGLIRYILNPDNIPGLKPDVSGQTAVLDQGKADSCKDDHISPEDLAQLAEGQMSQTIRVRALQHIDTCRICADILTGIIKALENEHGDE